MALNLFKDPEVGFMQPKPQAMNGTKRLLDTPGTSLFQPLLTVISGWQAQQVLLLEQAQALLLEQERALLQEQVLVRVLQQQGQALRQQQEPLPSCRKRLKTRLTKKQGELGISCQFLLKSNLKDPRLHDAHKAEDADQGAYSSTFL
jgi:hypothetical protein